MQNKRIQFLLALLAISVVYSWLSLFVFEDASDYEVSYSRPNSAVSQTKPTTQSPDIAAQDFKDIRNAANQSPISDSSASSSVSLPKSFLVRGLIVESADLLAAALIEYQGGLEEYELGNYILNTDMRITSITKRSLIVDYMGKQFTIDLTPPNLLAPDYRTPSESRSKLLNMTPKEIGARPRIIEHLLILTPTPYIADGQLVHPGLNPDLFKQAGFQEDDVLKTINGKSVTLEHELEQIKEELLTAHTLTFQVMRKGRIITLYLDIPSEALDVSYE